MAGSASTSSRRSSNAPISKLKGRSPPSAMFSSSLSRAPKVHTTDNVPPSTVRRKPKVTYPSPSMHNPAGLRVEGPLPTATQPKTAPLKIASRAAPSKANVLLTKEKIDVAHRVAEHGPVKALVKKKKYPMGPPLPLYHPLGRLALSLPELDPTALGLPPRVEPEDPTRRSSVRTRRPPARLRDADDDASSAATASPSLAQAVAAVVQPEKASPRKRRSGGGAGSKRKRREADTGDAAYPAKRKSRRGEARDATSPAESADAPTPNGVLLDLPEERKPERRSRRARGANMRRDSNASDATVATSVSVALAVPSVVEPAEPDTKDTDTMAVDEEQPAGEQAPRPGSPIVSHAEAEASNSRMPTPTLNGVLDPQDKSAPAEGQPGNTASPAQEGA